MSSAILYIAIVAIWAFVLIPRWLRRPHLLGGEGEDPAVPANAAEPDSVAIPRSRPNTAETREDQLSTVGSVSQSADGADATAVDQPPAARQKARGRVGAARRVAAPAQSRTRVLQARRRLLTVLVTITAAAGVCVYLKLTSWWALIPPGGMLGIYLLLLREAALADAEQARWRAALAHRAQTARQVARSELAERTAQVIDISDRLGDQLYDQYADATIRAVGD